MNPDDTLLPRIPVGTWVDAGFGWISDNLSFIFDIFGFFMRLSVGALTDGLLWLHPFVAILLFAVIALFFRSWKLSLATILGFSLVIAMDQWESMIQTMAMVMVATACAVVIAIPVGILAAKSDTVSSLVRPVLDFMQTMPAFVYLIPAVTLLSIGLVPGMLCTIIFALPPGVRMTELGIRQVDAETVEAGESFGATPGQILMGIQLPLAIPTIMAGVNQVIMLALSMAVIAGFVGADGSGKDVVQSIAQLNLALGVEAGLGVVVLAVFLDRLTAALGNPRDHPTSILGILYKAFMGRTTPSKTPAAQAAPAASATA